MDPRGITPSSSPVAHEWTRLGANGHGVAAEAAPASITYQAPFTPLAGDACVPIEQLQALALSEKQPHSAGATSDLEILANKSAAEARKSGLSGLSRMGASSREAVTRPSLILPLTSGAPYPDHWLLNLPLCPPVLVDSASLPSASSALSRDTKAPRSSILNPWYQPLPGGRAELNAEEVAAFEATLQTTFVNTKRLDVQQLRMLASQSQTEASPPNALLTLIELMGQHTFRWIPDGKAFMRSFSGHAQLFAALDGPDFKQHFAEQASLCEARAAELAIKKRDEELIIRKDSSAALSRAIQTCKEAILGPSINNDHFIRWFAAHLVTQEPGTDQAAAGQEHIHVVTRLITQLWTMEAGVAGCTYLPANDIVGGHFAKIRQFLSHLLKDDQIIAPAFAHQDPRYRKMQSLFFAAINEEYAAETSYSKMHKIVVKTLDFNYKPEARQRFWAKYLHDGKRSRYEDFHVSAESFAISVVAGLEGDRVVGPWWPEEDAKIFTWAHRRGDMAGAGEFLACLLDRLGSHVRERIRQLHAEGKLREAFAKCPVIDADKTIETFCKYLGERRLFAGLDEDDNEEFDV